MRRYELISQKEADGIIDQRVPIGTFLLNQRSPIGKYVGIDNQSGDAWVEEFETLEECIKWLEA